MIEPIICDIIREDVQGIPGIGKGTNEEIIYDGIEIKFKGATQASYGKHGSHVIGTVTGYAPLGIKKVKVGDIVKGPGLYFKVTAPPRQGLSYTVLELLLAR